MNNIPECTEAEEISWEEFLAAGGVISEDDNFKPTEPAKLDSYEGVNRYEEA